MTCSLVPRDAQARTLPLLQLLHANCNISQLPHHGHLARIHQLRRLLGIGLCLVSCFIALLPIVSLIPISSRETCTRIGISISIDIGPLLTNHSTILATSGYLGLA